MERDLEYRQRIVQDYRAKVEPLLRYLPWLEQKENSRAVSMYSGEGIGEHSLSIPVYDGTLMSFIKEAQRTGMLDRNYVYVYSQHRIRTIEDEKRAIEQAQLQSFEVLTGIMSKYVLGGMTKSVLWSQGVEEGIFLALVQKMKYILEYWDKPFA